MGFLNGKKALIVGLASNRSIAYGIAKSFHEQGAELAFTYQSEKLQGRVESMAAEFNSQLTFPCDVADDMQVNAVFEQLGTHWDKLDILVHSVAFAPADQISGDFIESCNREGFHIAHDISAYSLIGLAKAALPMMEGTEGSVITLSYYGAEKAVPNYNVMGIAKASLEASVRYLAASLGRRGLRVNAISAGPIKTLAAAGIKDFRKMQNAYANTTPLKRNVTAEEVGNTAAFLASSLSSGITGEVIHVDAGYHAVSMSNLEE
ncbi:enoyl-ACP reductase [Legionella quinlivanii]|uniref:Enoyl-[acyl-carrier-protein] reductase [NADH] n=1 Tax=Legionella quinlivanii TaxID=45073 RepID=A0A0W0Y0V2_9GAMM|nr:enoyl-ACP reductase [Legionella quinlivanii]KTD50228.1 enoyl-ACP reductase [Legionella quinlivanii]MCW8450028.1 enoyl-ACP reductase [Legionella quinlivanii]SEF46718.1 Enoyl-[acyl-carrier-protein] reductase [NADH] [Legionella quinlivanii DSM 21216]STY11826.1 enoyl-ACP reductase [Legionella quinlivanii]